jgi:hypothetical protein
MANEATKPQGAGDKCEDCHGTGEVDLIDGHEQPCAACMSREFAVKYAAQSADLEQLRAHLVSCIAFSDCEGDCTGEGTCAFNIAKKYLVSRAATKGVQSAE